MPLLTDFKLKRIDYISISIFCVALLFLLLFKVGYEHVFSINAQLIAGLLIGIGLLVCGIRSLQSVKNRENTGHNLMFMVGFFFSGVLIVLVSLVRLIFFKGN